jgi:predicted solute-binding protein
LKIEFSDLKSDFSDPASSSLIQVFIKKAHAYPKLSIKALGTVLSTTLCHRLKKK